MLESNFKDLFINIRPYYLHYSYSVSDPQFHFGLRPSVLMNERLYSYLLKNALISSRNKLMDQFALGKVGVQIIALE